MTMTDQKDISLPARPVKVRKKDEGFGELAKTAMIALLLAALIRSLAYEPFNIPSGSMFPTLQIGDYLFVEKYAYGYSQYSFPFGIVPIQGRVGANNLPARGDVIVFKLPSDPSIDYIKRVVGLPGDKVETIGGRLYINDKIVLREPISVDRIQNGSGREITVTRYIETLPNGVRHPIFEQSDTESLDNAGPFVVPKGHYFGMGDNRDNSRDSRVLDLVGYIPVENIVGRASIIFFSLDGSAGWLEIWKWPFAVRYDRLLTRVQSDQLGRGGEK